MCDLYLCLLDELSQHLGEQHGFRPRQRHPWSGDTHGGEGPSVSGRLKHFKCSICMNLVFIKGQQSYEDTEHVKQTTTGGLSSRCWLDDKILTLCDYFY